VKITLERGMGLSVTDGRTITYSSLQQTEVTDGSMYTVHARNRRMRNPRTSDLSSNSATWSTDSAN